MSPCKSTLRSARNGRRVERLIRRSLMVLATTLAGALGVLPMGRSQAAEPPCVAPGPVCAWDFDGSLDDHAGRVSDVLAPREGQLRFVDTKEVPGTSGKAVALGVRPGDAQYLAAPPSDDTRLGPNYTIEAWIQPTALTTWNRLVLCWGGPPHYAYHLALHDGQASLCHGQADGKYLFTEGGRVAVGQWHHIAGIARTCEEMGAGTLTVYLDGRPVGSAAFDGTIHTPPTEGLGIGESVSGPAAGTRFRGYVDEVAIWNRALSVEEIKAHVAKKAEFLSQQRLMAQKEQRETERA